MSKSALTYPKTYQELRQLTLDQLRALPFTPEGAAILAAIAANNRPTIAAVMTGEEVDTIGWLPREAWPEGLWEKAQRLMVPKKPEQKS